MLLYTIDSVVKDVLLKEGKPIHFYLQYLTYTISGIRELTFDSLRTVQVKKLPVTPLKTATLPCNYVNFIKIGYYNGQRIQQLHQDPHLNRLYNVDRNGNKVLYPDGECPVSVGAYKIIPERSEIQLSNDYPYDYLYVEYVDDGLGDCDCATRVDPLAMATLEAYIRWQYKLHSRTAGEGERMAAFQQYVIEHKKLRARKNDLTIEDIKRWLEYRGNPQTNIRYPDAQGGSQNTLTAPSLTDGTGDILSGELNDLISYD